MKRYIILGSIFFLLSGCGGGGSSSAAATVTPTPTPTTTPIPPVESSESGNGVFNYSVATDYFYGQNNESPSLKYDLSQYPSTNTKYVFPVFGYLTTDNHGTFTNPASSAITCGSAPAVFNYYAEPAVSNTVVPGASSHLGGCVDGKTATTYYSGFISHVVPTVEYDPTFITAITGASTATLVEIADNVASVINSDPNAYGVAFDNEPALNTVIEASGELVFFGELATKLAANKKYLFLFDANATGISIYENGYDGQSLNNIILMQPLYDLEDVGNYTNGPVSLSTYTTDVAHAVTSDLSDKAGPPVLFVAPASSTATIWTYLQGYNMEPTGESYQNPTTVSTTAACISTEATTSGTIDNNILSLMLCNSTTCPGVAATNITNYLSTANCVNYTNPSNVQNEYFTSSLSAIQDNVAASPNASRYLGTTLYAWRISGYNDIGCGKYYYSLYTQDGLAAKLCTEQSPADILPISWSAFNTWTGPN